MDNSKMHVEHKQSQNMVGDYIITQRIGAGSFAVVWKGRHKILGTEVAIKEIAMEKLNRKLRESLESEISILKCSNHPNIIQLRDIVKSQDRIFLVTEYCAGGDLSDFIRRAGRASEETSRHFMQQLAAGLFVLREHNLIHRDLKPQNLLLSSKGSDAVLKIADFGFARSLQPQGLAETLCGSPLYMAPEILQFQKYDAKADLWSVGAILFELLTGRPPFGGQNHVQLLRNIERTEAVIPATVAATLSESVMHLCKSLLRRNPVERLSFEDFFHHPFLELQRFTATTANALFESNILSTETKTTVQILQHSGSHITSPQENVEDVQISNTTEEDDLCGAKSLPFAINDITPLYSNQKINNYPVESLHNLVHGELMDCTQNAGKFLVDDECEKTYDYNNRKQKKSSETFPEEAKNESLSIKASFATGCLAGKTSVAEEILKREGNLEQEPRLITSMEIIEKEYVIVDTPLAMSSSSTASCTASPSTHPAAKMLWSMRWLSPSSLSAKKKPEEVGRKHVHPASSTSASSTTKLQASLSVPVLLSAGMSAGSPGTSYGSRGSTPSSLEAAAEGLSVAVLEPPSTDPSLRLESLQHCATHITAIAVEKLESQRAEEALSLQLLALAVWKKSLEICHAWAEAAADSRSISSLQSPTSGTSQKPSRSLSHPLQGPNSGAMRSSRHSSKWSSSRHWGREEEESCEGAIAASVACAMVEREFLAAVQVAESMALEMQSQSEGNLEMPDVIELVFQSALTLGRTSGVEEWMGNLTGAESGYLRSAALFHFLLVEASYLPLSPPFHPSATDYQRLRKYFDSVTSRLSQCKAQKIHMASDLMNISPKSREYE